MNNKILNRSSNITSVAVTNQKNEHVINPVNYHSTDIDYTMGNVIQSVECRICMEGGNLIQPCRCTGTAAYAHFSCLKIWIQKIKEKHKDKAQLSFEEAICQVCNYKMKVHTVSQAQYIFCEVDDQNEEVCHFKTALISFIVLLFLGVLFICVVLLARADARKNEASLLDICLTVGGICCLIIGIALLIFYIRKYCIKITIQIIGIQKYDPELDFISNTLANKSLVPIVNAISQSQ